MNPAHLASKRRWATALLSAAAALTLVALAAQGPGATEDPVALVRTCLEAATADTRAAAASRLVAHADYRPSRLPEWLHRAGRFPDLLPGPHPIMVTMGPGDARRVHLIVPEGYRQDRPWPLIYALHPSGASGQEWAEQVRAMLGTRAREFVIAAPDDYRQNYIAARPPFIAEHPAMLDAVARTVHVAADRVYAFGYSKGAFGAWFTALYYPDRLAGAIAFAGGFDVTVGDDGFWKQVVMNVAHVPIYNAWGERDSLAAQDLDGKPAGTFVEQNRRFVRAIHGLGLPIVNTEVAGGVHNSLAPPAQPMIDILAARRLTDPRSVNHTFRHLHQASCYWLEGLSWAGARWSEERPPLLPTREGESESQVSARTFASLLGRLTGTIEGQTIRVTRRHIGELVIWFGEKTINWERPVRVEVDDSLVFEGRLTRDAGVALARAAMTRDFDALRWAGLRVDAAGKATPVTADNMPRPAWMSGM